MEGSANKKQRVHMWAVHILPLLSLPLAALFHLTVQPVTWFEPLLFIVSWMLVGGLGITVGYHRHFTHRAFGAAPALRWTMAALGSMAGQGPLTYWVALHRKHHRFSDIAGDPHSPVANPLFRRGRLQGLLHSHFYWIGDVQPASLGRYAVDLVRDPVARETGRYYYQLIILGQVIPALVGALWYQSVAGGGALDCSGEDCYASSLAIRSFGQSTPSATRQEADPIRRETSLEITSLWQFLGLARGGITTTTSRRQ